MGLATHSSSQSNSVLLALIRKPAHWKLTLNILDSSSPITLTCSSFHVYRISGTWVPLVLSPRIHDLFPNGVYVL